MQNASVVRTPIRRNLPDFPTCQVSLSFSLSSLSRSRSISSYLSVSLSFCRSLFLLPSLLPSFSFLASLPPSIEPLKFYDDTFVFNFDWHILLSFPFSSSLSFLFCYLFDSFFFFFFINFFLHRIFFFLL